MLLPFHRPNSLPATIAPVRDPSSNWEAIAATHPYFGVLTDPRFLGNPTPESLAEFFRTGQADADYLLSLTGSPAPRRVLDFGCGVGRLSLAFAHRADEVVGIDVSPTMRALAARHRDAAGIENVKFDDSLPDGEFDLIISLIVFQHIPVAAGEELLRQLLARLAPGGAAALHFTFTRSGGRLRRAARTLRATFPLVHRIAQRIQRDPIRLPYIEMNEYDRARVLAIFEEAGCEISRVVPTDHGGMPGGIVVARRRERIHPPTLGG